MASMQLTISYQMEDGTSGKIVADQRDIAQWEIQPFGCPLPDLESRMMLGARWLCWHALSRTGGTDLKWEKFSGLCVEALPLAPEGVDALDPGLKALPDEPSSGSVSELGSPTRRSRAGTRGTSTRQ
jgi:hypothetical protein